MKIENLTIIFAVIIIPIAVVLSIYINNKIEANNLNLTYNKRLFNATQDAVNAYQSNTTDDVYADVTNAKIADIESSINVFMASLASNFNYIGYKAEALKQYVPAVVFTLYDGYYIYSPFSNTLTEVEDNDPQFSKQNEIIKGLKPYVYYTCRYQPTDNGGTNNRSSILGSDFFITYTLDNFITIQGKLQDKDKLKCEYIYDYGYLYYVGKEGDDIGDKGISKIKKNEKYIYKYRGIEFQENDTEELKEYVGGKEFSYVKINGKKYYLDEDFYADREGVINLKNGKSVKASSAIFYIDAEGKKSYAQTKGYSTTTNSNSENNEFLLYCEAIKNNKSSYEYFKNAYEFSSAVLMTPVQGYQDKAGTTLNEGYGLLNTLWGGDAVYWKEDSVENKNENKITAGVADRTPIFGREDCGIEDENSKFNAHRKNVIRYVIETNLSAAIAGYKDSTKSDIDYIMPKISETDWDNIENEVCVISFLQGMSIGSKIFNSYKVVPNSYTTDHIDDDDIYLLKNDNTYCRITDNSLDGNLKTKAELGYEPGVWKLNCKLKKILEPAEEGNPAAGNKEIWYFPIRYGADSSQAYTGSYTSVITNYDITPQGNKGFFEYLNDKDDTLKKVYLTALARERWGGFNINNINYEIYGNNGNEYFLKDY